MGKLTGKGGDDSASDAEIALQQQEYQDNLKEEQEQVQELDKEEMAFLNSQGGLTYASGPTTPGKINSPSGS